MDEKKEAEREIRVIKVRPAVSGNSSHCGNARDSAGEREKDTERGNRKQKEQIYNSISI